jgi:hypothetical protein
MSGIPQNWRDLAALIDPSGRCNDPCGENRDLDWYKIYALATSNMVAPTLYSQLVKKNCLHLAPIEVQHALRELHHLNKARNSRQQSVLKDTVRILNTRGIEPLLLKGSISLLSETMSEVTDRMMSDIDIALYNAPPERGEEALIQSGYRHAIGQEPAEYPNLFCHLNKLSKTQYFLIGTDLSYGSRPLSIELCIMSYIINFKMRLLILIDARCVSYWSLCS